MGAGGERDGGMKGCWGRVGANEQEREKDLAHDSTLLPHEGSGDPEGWWWETQRSADN